MAETKIFHGTAVAIDGKGILLSGEPGCGKSDLALRLIDRGAKLISDDAVAIHRGADCPIMAAAPNIAGKLEVRALGILSFAYVDNIPLHLLVELDKPAERYPLQAWSVDIVGFAIAAIALNGHEASAPIKVELALDRLSGHDGVDVRAE